MAKRRSMIHSGGLPLSQADFSGRASIDWHEVAQHFRSGKTLSRSLLNERVSGVELGGRIVDLGAGRLGSSSYHRAFRILDDAEVWAVDLDHAKEPHCVADLEAALPFKEESFSVAIAFNVLEHLFDFATALREVARVLRRGGIIHLAVPFLMRVHADPADYFRYTFYALDRVLGDAGFAEIRIQPLGAGALTAALAQVDFAVPAVLRPWAFRSSITLDRLITRRSAGRFRNENDYPVGYYATAAKS